MKTQFYFYSGILHFAIFASLFVVFKPVITKPKPPQIFTIDLIGGMQEIMESAAPSRKAVSKPEKTKPDSDYIVTTKVIKKEKISLATPSILKDVESEKTDLPPPSVSSEGGVKAEFPDFPYPWYITQVRAALWNEWSGRMPRSGQVSAVAVFKIQRDGTIKNLKIEKSSGNKLFDFAATASVQNALPFPPLPDDYEKDELTVHVEFKIVE